MGSKNFQSLDWPGPKMPSTSTSPAVGAQFRGTPIPLSEERKGSFLKKRTKKLLRR
jgi:hypothetical protein